MFGTQSNDYALEYVAKARARQGAQRHRKGPPLRWLGLIIVLLVAGIVVFERLDLELWSSPDTPTVIAEGGCLDFDMGPTGEESPMPLEEIVEDIRVQTDGVVSKDVHWAKFGYPQRARGAIRGGGRTEHRTPVWTIVFEDEFDQRTVSRLWNERGGDRFTVFYNPDDQRITRSCGAWKPRHVAERASGPLCPSSLDCARTESADHSSCSWQFC
jgi:hypothetical protein